MIEIQYRNLSQIIDYRIEAEYFGKKFIKNEQLLSRIQCKKFNEIAKVENGRAYSSDAFSQNGDLYISKIGDVTNKRGIEIWDKLNIEEFEHQKGELLTDGDILMTLTGDPPDVGKVNLISIDGKECTWNQRVAKITTCSEDYRSNYVLYAVLSSEICRVQMERFAKGIRQRNLGNDCFGFVDIPVFDEDLQQKLEWLIKKHIYLQEKSKKLYLKAEHKLEFCIGINKESHINQSSIKFYKESFKKTGRLDSEYYQSKFDVLFNILKKFSNKRLGGDNGIVNIKKSIEPGSETYKSEGIPFVRVSDISKYEITSPEIYLSRDIVENVESLFPKKDTILLSKDGSVGIAYKLERDEDIITSGALLQLTVKNVSEVLPDYLTLVLNSGVVQMQAERDTNGAIIQHWKPSEIENVIIPVLNMEHQKELAEIVKKSFDLRRQAKQLLEYAKLAVDMAIEQGENVALTWLKANIANLEV